MPQPNVNKTCAVMAMLCAVLLTGCATKPQPRVEICPPPPPMPPALQPQPQQTYSKAAQENIKRWQEQLTGTPATR